MDAYFNAIYSFLVEYEYFTEDELRLVTDINGNRTEVLNDCCRARYALDIEDLLEEQEYLIW